MQRALGFIYRHLPGKRARRFAKTSYYRTKAFLARSIFSFDVEELGEELKSLGVRPGDTVMMHSSFSAFTGFRGTPQDVIKALLGIIGPSGNLLMVSMPYTSASLHYLQEDPVLDVRRTMSHMGIISEVFRRTAGVVRSLSPTHPVLACGKDAAWLIEGHEHCPRPCGRGSPFEKLHTVGGKVLFFDARFGSFTFIHYLEEFMEDHLPFPLYHDKAFAARVLGYDGQEFRVTTHVFGEQAFSTRNPGILEKELRKRSLLKRKRIGDMTLMLVSTDDAMRCMLEMVDEGILPFSLQ